MRYPSGNQISLDAVNAISDTIRDLTPVDDTSDEFVAEHTMNIAGTAFDGLSKNLHPVTRRTFHDDDHRDRNPATIRNIRSVQGLAKVVEMVSMALLDVNQDSYGRSGYDDEHSYRVLSNVTFSPEGCIWNATVKYSAEQLTKSVTNKMVSRIYEGTFPIRVVCTSVLLSDDYDQENDNGDNSDSADDGDSLSYQHHSIDLTMKLTFDVRSIDKLEAKSMTETLSRVSYDISQQLFKGALPIFAEGRKGTAFRTVYQLNSKIKSGVSARTLYIMR